jgi:hypothetical protein
MHRKHGMASGWGLAARIGFWSFLVVATAGATDVPDFGASPPALERITITPLAASAEGNAVLDLDYAKDQTLPDEIPFYVSDKPVRLLRDQANPQHFSATIPFDFDAFVDDQAQRQTAAARGAKEDVFAAREFVGSRAPDFIDPGLLRESILRREPIAIPLRIGGWTQRNVSAARSLMVTDSKVVDDPLRTYNACTRDGNPNGAWTFKTLMTNIANTPVTGVDPADLVEDWLKIWNSDITVNGHLVPARLIGSNTLAMNAQVLDQWPRELPKLDLNKSPMRLLAIVNRLDLRGNTGYASGSAGELRFVFGVLDPGTCDPLPFTVILEYGVPIKGCNGVHHYARQWVDLTAMTPGNPDYNSALQALTDISTQANAAPRKPNRSAINQIRTDEILQAPWQLREFQLSAASHKLQMAPPALTPDESYNISFDDPGLIPPFHNDGFNNPLLRAYLTNPANIPSILAERHVVPTSMLAGMVPNHLSQMTWRTQNPAAVNNEVRHHFSLNTCNACHGPETNQNAFFLHVEPRDAGSAAQLSQFLVGTKPGCTVDNPCTVTIPDPVEPGTLRTYGDLRRRMTDLAHLDATQCLATGVFDSLQFVPMTASH